MIMSFILKPASHCLIIRWFDKWVGKLDGKFGNGSAQLDDRMRFSRIGWNWMGSDMSYSIDGLHTIIYFYCCPKCITGLI